MATTKKIELNDITKANIQGRKITDRDALVREIDRLVIQPADQRPKMKDVRLYADKELTVGEKKKLLDERAQELDRIRAERRASRQVPIEEPISDTKAKAAAGDAEAAARIASLERKTAARQLEEMYRAQGMPSIAARVKAQRETGLTEEEKRAGVPSPGFAKLAATEGRMKAQAGVEFCDGINVASVRDIENFFSLSPQQRRLQYADYDTYSEYLRNAAGLRTSSTLDPATGLVTPVDPLDGLTADQYYSTVRENLRGNVGAREADPHIRRLDGIIQKARQPTPGTAPPSTAPPGTAPPTLSQPTVRFIDRVAASMTTNELDAMLILLGREPTLGEVKYTDLMKKTLLREAYQTLITRTPGVAPPDRLVAWTTELFNALDLTHAPPTSPLFQPAIYSRYMRSQDDIMESGQYLIERILGERETFSEHARRWGRSMHDACHRHPVRATSVSLASAGAAAAIFLL